MNRVILYGAGRFCGRLLDLLPGAEASVAAFADRDEKKTSFRGLPVLRPEQLNVAGYASLPIVITVKDRGQAEQDLKARLSLPEERFLPAEEWVAQALENPAVQLRPSMVRLDASTRCQLNCAGCYMRLDPLGILGSGDMPLECFTCFLDENPFIRSVELSNSGEPFLNPDLRHILRTARERDVEITLSNGVNMNSVSPQVLEELVRSQVKQITVSLDGACQETYSRYRRGGSFDAVIRNIRALNRLKAAYHSSYPRLLWQFILMPEDEEDVEAAIAMAKDLEMEIFFKQDSRGGFEPRNPEKLRQLTGVRYSTETEYRERLNDYYCRFCSQLLYSPQVNWDGRLLGCCTRYKTTWNGNVFEEGFLPCINRPEYRGTIAALLRGKPSALQTPCMSCSIWKKMLEKGLHLEL